MIYVRVFRCQIPECGESTKDLTFDASWLSNAIPAASSGTGFASCERFSPTGSANGTLDYCPANLFTSTRQECDGFVYARDNSVVYDVSGPPLPIEIQIEIERGYYLNNKLFC